MDEARNVVVNSLYKVIRTDILDQRPIEAKAEQAYEELLKLEKSYKEEYKNYDFVALKFSLMAQPIIRRLLNDKSFDIDDMLQQAMYYWRYRHNRMPVLDRFSGNDWERDMNELEGFVTMILDGELPRH